MLTVKDLNDILKQLQTMIGAKIKDEVHMSSANPISQTWNKLSILQLELKNNQLVDDDAPLPLTVEEKIFRCMIKNIVDLKSNPFQGVIDALNKKYRNLNIKFAQLFLYNQKNKYLTNDAISKILQTQKPESSLPNNNDIFT